MKDLKQLQKDAETLRLIANDIEKGNIQSFIFVGKKTDEYISMHPYGINETRELRNILDDAIMSKFLRENICNFLEYVN